MRLLKKYNISMGTYKYYKIKLIQGRKYETRFLS